jgi:hypothetical protein
MAAGAARPGLSATACAAGQALQLERPNGSRLWSSKLGVCAPAAIIYPASATSAGSPQLPRALAEPSRRAPATGRAARALSSRKLAPTTPVVSSAPRCLPLCLQAAPSGQPRRRILQSAGSGCPAPPCDPTVDLYPTLKAHRSSASYWPLPPGRTLLGDPPMP